MPPDQEEEKKRPPKPPKPKPPEPPKPKKEEEEEDEEEKKAREEGKVDDDAVIERYLDPEEDITIAEKNRQKGGQ